MSGKGSKQRPTDKSKFDVNYDRIFGNTENHKRNVRTLAENAKDKKMTRKVDTYEYEDLKPVSKQTRCQKLKLQNYLQIKTFINGTQNETSSAYK
jgi:hypothetical protein